MPFRMQDIMDAMQAIAPLEYAEEWDNVGLLLGKRDAPARRVMLTIDLTEDVMAEAIQKSTQAVISYHPVLFKATKRITDQDPMGRLLLLALHHDMAVYSPHTALDAIAGGVTDWLADCVGSGYRRPLVPTEMIPVSRNVKLVTFVPAADVDRLRDALASAGGGRIGDYSHCTFGILGEGTFWGREGATNPSVGQSGSLQRVEEVRMEMVCPAKALPALIATLRHFHPYEEPAFDLIPLRPIPVENTGSGRKIVLDQPVSVETIAHRVKEHLGIPALKATDPSKVVSKVAVIPGSGADFLETVIQEECDLFLTGEMTHHQALSAELRGCSVILTGHTNSERGYLPFLRDRLLKALPNLEIEISRMDRSRFSVI